MVASSRRMNQAAAGRIGKVVPTKLAPPDPFGKSPRRDRGDRLVTASWGRRGGERDGPMS